MTKTPFIAAAAALIALSACNENKPEEVSGTAPDPMASQLANAAPVQLPPAMTASVTFRCKDNSLAYVDFFKGNTEMHLRLAKGDTPIILKADKDGDPLKGDGYTVTGDQDKISLTKPGGSALECHH